MELLLPNCTSSDVSNSIVSKIPIRPRRLSRPTRTWQSKPWLTLSTSWPRPGCLKRSPTRQRSKSIWPSLPSSIRRRSKIGWPKPKSRSWTELPGKDRKLGSPTRPPIPSKGKIYLLKLKIGIKLRLTAVLAVCLNYISNLYRNLN